MPMCRTAGAGDRAPVECYCRHSVAGPAGVSRGRVRPGPALGRARGL